MKETYYLTKFLSAYFVLPHKQKQKQKGGFDDVSVTRKMSEMVMLFSKENNITDKGDMAYKILEHYMELFGNDGVIMKEQQITTLKNLEDIHRLLEGKYFDDTLSLSKVNALNDQVVEVKQNLQNLSAIYTFIKRLEIEVDKPYNTFFEEFTQILLKSTEFNKAGVVTHEAVQKFLDSQKNLLSELQQKIKESEFLKKLDKLINILESPYDEIETVDFHERNGPTYFIDSKNDMRKLLGEIDNQNGQGFIALVRNLFWNIINNSDSDSDNERTQVTQNREEFNNPNYLSKLTEDTTIKGLITEYYNLELLIQMIEYEIATLNTQPSLERTIQLDKLRKDTVAAAAVVANKNAERAVAAREAAVRAATVAATVAAREAAARVIQSQSNKRKMIQNSKNKKQKTKKQRNKK